MSDVTLGSIVDGLGAHWHSDPGDLPTDAVIIVKYVDNEGRVGLRISSTEGISWIERTGMLHIATAMQDNDLREWETEGDDE